jgi:hypothetical protein
LEAQTGLLASLAQCFDDHRDPELVEHTVEELLKQRVFALALGYEDLNDHDALRTDPLLATLVGKRDPLGQERVDPRDRGKALAGKSTLNRLELTPVGAGATSRYKKIVARHGDLESWFVQVFLQLTPQAPTEIVLDLARHRRPAARAPVGPLLPRLLQALLLPAALRLLRRASAVRETAAGRHRRGGGLGESRRADRRADPPRVAAGANHPPWRQRVLSRELDELV